MRVVAVGGLQHDDLTRGCLRTHLSICEAKTVSDTMVHATRFEPDRARHGDNMRQRQHLSPSLRGLEEENARVSGLFSMPARASRRRQLLQGSEGLDYHDSRSTK